MTPGTEEEHRREALERARRLTEGARKQGLEVEDNPEGEKPTWWRGTSARHEPSCPWLGGFE